MPYFLIFCCIFLGLLQSSLFAESTGNQIIQLGDWHGDDVSAASNVAWYGLFVEGDKSELKLGKIIVKPIKDELIIDEGEKQTGKRVQFQCAGKTYTHEDLQRPIFLLQGDQFQSGIISSSRITESKYIYPGETLYLNEQYALFATGAVDDSDSESFHPIVNNYCLKLVETQANQIQYYSSEIACWDKLEEAQIEILFAGDLNQDQIPDLVIEGSTHYNSSNIQLFLSGRNRRGGVLLSKVAEFHTIGC